MNYLQELKRKPLRILSVTKQNGVIRFKINSSTDARKHYAVVNRDGKWSCACKGWIFPRKVVMKDGKPVLRSSDGKILKVRVNCSHIKRAKGAVAN